MKNNYLQKSMLSFVVLFSVLAFLSAQVEISPPLSYYDFEGDGTDLIDAGSAGNNGTIVGEQPGRSDSGITTNAEDGNGSILFEGGVQGDYLGFPYQPHYNATDYTLAVWLKYEVNTDWGAYVFWADGPEYPPDTDGIESERHIDLWTNGSAGENRGWTSSLSEIGSTESWASPGTTTAYGSDFLTDEAWHLCVYSLEDNTTVKIYCDGVLLIENVSETGVAENVRQADLWIGTRPNGAGSFQGYVDRFRFWDEVLTLEQIEALLDYEGPEGGNPDAVQWGPSGIFNNNATSALLSVFPNPTAGLTNFEFDLTSGGMVNLSIHDISGKEVTVVEDDYKMTGKHTISFDADKLSSGIYFVVLQSQDETSTCKLIVD